MPVVSLLLFTRYPRPGQTKTRLIPALGADGAATVQRRMTELVVATARRFASLPERRLEIWATGADFRTLGLWLGFDLKYRDQGAGDLGQRLLRAVGDTFAQGTKAVIVMGSDCPALSVAHIDEAAKLLSAGTDLVLGPAHDGGYYLIGLNQVAVSLFENIPWGTEKVMAATLKAASRLDLRVQQLALLADIDRPQDLIFWRQVAEPQLTVVIPVLNEADNLPRTLEALKFAQYPGVVEVIVVDGGSTDNSVVLVQDMGCRVLSCEPGRGRQMNVGAQAGLGKYLLFLHADTILPANYLDLVSQCLSRPGVAAGAFSLAIADRRPAFRFLEKLISWRSRFFGWPYGDQAFFMERAMFDRVGGFWLESLLEDVDMLRKIKKLGRLVILPSKVVTSARRWQSLGVVFSTIINQLVMLGYYLRVPPKYLASLYLFRR